MYATTNRTPVTSIRLFYPFLDDPGAMNHMDFDPIYSEEPGMDTIHAIHRGYDIRISREECMIGFFQLYFAIFRQSDLHLCISGYVAENTCQDTLMATLKNQIDCELQKADPWEKPGSET